ncbi:MAG: acetyl-CoA carboxylase carboxyltransferase subunit alpha [Halobacteriovoraceae bacterium]|nr:acetyl-CoA carboxylase carboxyltransferase subunit alpha [Halobacteriovoraceae bacterium]
MSELTDYALEFEKPVRALENQIQELKEASSAKPELNLDKEVLALQQKVNLLIKEIYGNLTSWERVLLSRHPKRPHGVDYIRGMIDNFHEIAGDRRFANDAAIITGFGYIGTQKVAVVAIEKGRKNKEKIKCNFGMPRPEGYRKALRLMQMAGRFEIPILSLVDTPGAYPGIGAEERGQACAIADNLEQMFEIPVPIISVVIGEGGSGGALGIAIADRVLMMEYSIYSVISPESCASILWTDPKRAQIAANSLQLGPHKAYKLKVVDGIIAEPVGGAHRDHKKACSLVRKSIDNELKNLLRLTSRQLIKNRYAKFRKMGNMTIEIPPQAKDLNG